VLSGCESGARSPGRPGHKAHSKDEDITSPESLLAACIASKMDAATADLFVTTRLADTRVLQRAGNDDVKKTLQASTAEALAAGVMWTLQKLILGVWSTHHFGRRRNVLWKRSLRAHCAAAWFEPVFRLVTSLNSCQLPVSPVFRLVTSLSLPRSCPAAIQPLTPGEKWVGPNPTQAHL
jgi:hypothetical protein